MRICAFAEGGKVQTRFFRQFTSLHGAVLVIGPLPNRVELPQATLGHLPPKMLHSRPGALFPLRSRDKTADRVSAHAHLLSAQYSTELQRLLPCVIAGVGTHTPPKRPDMATTSASGSAPMQAPTPDLSWFCCICCARRPMPHASFSMLLTTCSHIVCSSCWNGRGNGECPKCETKANTLNLSTLKQLPKQLEPYYKTPVELLKNLLAVCEIQERQKRQMLGRRKVAWVLINHKRAKEDYEKEYAECKQLWSVLNQRKRAIRQAADNLRRRGIDPVKLLTGKVDACVIKTITNTPTTPTASTPSTPFLPTPLARPPSTSTPAVPGTTPPNVEFVEPKKLPHTMRGSVTSKGVRRSPSNPPTPLLVQPQNPGSVLPAKKMRATATPVHVMPPAYNPQLGQPMEQSPIQPGQTLRLSGHPAMQTGQPMRQLRQPTPQTGYPIRQTGQTMIPAGRPIMQVGQPVNPMQQPTMQSQPINRFGQSATQFGQHQHAILQSTSRQMVQPGLPHGIQSVQPIIPPRRPIYQPQPIPRSSIQTPQQQAAVLGRSGSSVRIRAVPPSSVPQRIFPSPAPSQRSHSTPSQPYTLSPSHGHQRPAMTSSSGTHTAGIERVNRISVRPSAIPPSHSHSTASQNLSWGRVRTPTNPSPLLYAFTPRSSPWRQGQGSHGSGSPWKPDHTPPPGTRLSAGSTRSGSGGRARLTPMKS